MKGDIMRDLELTLYPRKQRINKARKILPQGRKFRSQGPKIGLQFWIKKKISTFSLSEICNFTDLWYILCIYIYMINNLRFVGS